MADRGDTHYHVPNLNLWFLLSSGFFLLTMIWTVIDDATTEWKEYQRDFRQLEYDLAEETRQALVDDGTVAQRDELRARVDAAQAAVDAERAEPGGLDELTSAFLAAKEEFRQVEGAFKSDEAQRKWAIWQFERDRVESDDPEEIAEIQLGIEELWTENQRRAAAVEQAAHARDAAEEALQAAKDVVTEAEKALAVATADLRMIEARMEALRPSDIPTRVASFLRDAPGIDFVGPNLKVVKQIPPGVTLNLNFTKKPVIDMCATCHMGIDRAGFEGDDPETGEPIRHPYRTHPNLDLYLTSGSPHPLKDFGCTVCHRGSGESLSFQHADHRPDELNPEFVLARHHADHELFEDSETVRWHAGVGPDGEPLEQPLGWHGKQHHWDYPMLTTQHTEASCVQCHKTSMELIAPDAPKLTEGYRLVERYGCYACHKIDWFPTKRRPGPSLLQSRGKLTREFAEAWIAKPRDFRPTTWMPQVFHLENYGANETVVVANYGELDADGLPKREIKGQEWNDNAAAAVARFLFANHEQQEFPPVPFPGNAERGREVMNVSGCYACHDTEPYPGEEENALGNDSDQAGRYNTKGPNLRGVATKINPEWLFAWIKDPAAYWADTNMPNLRLPDQDIADVVAYMLEDPDGIFTDVPDDWDPATRVTALDREVLQEQARWYFQKDGRSALAAKFENEWADTEALAVAVGRAFVLNQGCFSCHEIGGMLSEMPVGAELSNWGSKTVDKLDFGLSYRKQLKLPRNVVASAVHQKGDENGQLTELDYHYREGWLARKLAHPRSFDLDKVKNPKEKLRMPWFDFTDEQIEALSTFVLGLVDDDVPGAKMQPTAEQLAMDAGHRAVRQKNCAACHMLEPGRVTFLDEAGVERTVAAELGAFAGDVMPLNMTSLEDVLAQRAQRTAWLLDDPDLDDEDRADLAVELGNEQASVRLWEAAPDVGAPFQSLQVPFERLLAITPPEGGDYVRHQTSYYRGGARVTNPDYDPQTDPPRFRTNPWTYHADYDAWTFPVADYVDGEPRDYTGEEYDAVRWTFAPPVLVNEGHKLQRDWFFSFLKDPVRLRKQMRAKMPTFHYADGEAESIADYFAGKAREDWFSRYARTMRLTLGREAKPDLLDGSTTNAWQFPEDAQAWPTAAHTTAGTGLSLSEVARGAGLRAEQVANIERGYQPEVRASFDKLFEFGEAQGFRMTGRVPEEYEQLVRQSRTHLLEFGYRIPLGHDVAVEPGGVDCLTCHPKPDGSFAQDPIAWAPPLENVRQRLREEWVREWLWSPKLVYPGTKMADNFANDVPAYQAHYPDSSNAQQIDAVMDWLYNMEGGTAVEAVGSNFDPNDLSDQQLLAMLHSRGQLTGVELSGDDQPGDDTEPGGDEQPGGGDPPPVEEPPPVEDPPVVEEPPPVVASGPGVVTGRVLFDGTPPAAKTVAITAEQGKGCCADGGVGCIDNRDRGQAIGAGGGIQYAVVTIEVEGAKATVPSEPVVLDQKSCRYEPHVLVMPVGAQIQYANSDTIAHNVHTYAQKNETLNKAAPPGTSALKQTLGKAETIRIGCDLHPWMGAYVVVTEATHWAVTDADGNFSIAGLPPGEHRVEVWHESFATRPERAKVVVPADGAAAPPLVVKLGGSGGRGRR
jgi:cytochrome c2/plastocyanin